MIVPASGGVVVSPHGRSVRLAVGPIATGRNSPKPGVHLKAADRRCHQVERRA